MSANCLELKGVCKSFSGFELKDISFSLPNGYIMGIVGPNGAGKTTTIQLILDMLQRDAGEISVFGLDNIKDSKAIKQDIGVIFDSIFYVDNWTVKDTEKAVSIFYDDWNSNIFMEMIKRFELPLNKKICKFSRGMQMKLMLACALSHNAKLLILDEPTSGLDPVTRDDFLEIIQDFIKDGERSVLFSTHITTDLEQVADFITFIKNGKMIYSGKTDDLIGSYRIIKGKREDLTIELKKKILGLRMTEVGFDGLIDVKEPVQYKHCILDSPTINDIVIRISKGEII